MWRLGGAADRCQQGGFQFWSDLEIYLYGGTAVSEEDIMWGVVILASLGLCAVVGAVAFFVTFFFDKASAGRCAELSRHTGFQLLPLSRSK